jgi:hypothetical protein
MLIMMLMMIVTTAGPSLSPTITGKCSPGAGAGSRSRGAGAWCRSRRWPSRSHARWSRPWPRAPRGAGEAAPADHGQGHVSSDGLTQTDSDEIQDRSQTRLDQGRHMDPVLAPRHWKKVRRKTDPLLSNPLRLSGALSLHPHVSHASTVLHRRAHTDHAGGGCGVAVLRVVDVRRRRQGRVHCANKV